MSNLRITKRRFLKSLTGVALTACGGSLKHFSFDTYSKMDANLGLELTFYGVGCFGIRCRGSQILTDPFFTYLPLMKVAFGTVLPDPKQVDPYITELQDVAAMLVGHAHYDHNLDLPYIAEKLHKNSYVLGSKTLKHTFAPNNLPTPFVVMNDRVATQETLGEWWVHPNKKFRVLPILSAHPNQYLFFHLYKKNISEDRTTVPKKVHHYQEGMTFAFLIDFLNIEGQPDVRVYVQSSSTGLPMGAFPKSILDEKSIDIACVAMDCANKKMNGEVSVIDEYPATHTFFCHYEDFFRTKEQVPKEIVKVDLPKAKEFFLDTSKQAFYFPKADARFIL